MVINANEARDKYDSYKIAAERYIDSVIEPQINQAALNTKFIALKIIDAWYQGYYFEGYDNKEDLNKVLVYEEICNILEEAGLTMGNIVKTTVFLQDMSFFAGMNGVYATYFDGAFPARSAVAVKALPKDALVEIECIAVR